jgi:two-component system sensor kinase FixL
MGTSAVSLYGASAFVASKISLLRKHFLNAPAEDDRGRFALISRLVKADVADNAFPENATEEKGYEFSNAPAATLHRTSRTRFNLFERTRHMRADSETVTSDLLESLPIAIVGISKQETIAFANASAIELFGYQRTCMHSMSTDTLFPRARAQGLRLIPDAGVPAHDAQPNKMTVFAKKADDTEFLAEITTNVCRINGVLVRLALIVDRSERSELHRRAQELAHLTRVSSLGELAGSLAHELNQPLTAILSNAQAVQHFIKKNPIDLREISESLKDIVADNCRASEIIRRIRTLVRNGKIEVQSLDVDSLIRDVMSLVQSDALVRGIQTRVHIGEHLLPVRGDKVQLQQVVLNLLLNAFDAVCDGQTPDRKVDLEVSSGSGAVQIAVRDRGPGMTVEQLDMVFKPFFTSKPHGLGLGLSISRTIVLKHGGSIWAENNLDRGATFYINLPAEGTAGESRECGECEL